MSDKLKQIEPAFYVGLVIIKFHPTPKVLLAERSEDKKLTGPGGGALIGETPKQAMIREAYEEAGLKILESNLLELPTLIGKNGKIVHGFLLTGDVNDITEGRHTNNDPDDETKTWKWMPLNGDYREKMGETRFQNFVNAKMQLEGLAKAIVENPGADIDLNTTDESINEMASKNRPLADRIRDSLKDTQYGEVVDLFLENFRVLYLAKVDEGIYSGFVKENDPEKGNYGEIITRVEKMTPESIVQSLKAKEVLSHEKTQTELKTEVLETPSDDANIELLQQLLNNYTGDLHIHLHKSLKKSKGEGSRGGVVVGHTASGEAQTKLTEHLKQKKEQKKQAFKEELEDRVEDFFGGPSLEWKIKAAHSIIKQAAQSLELGDKLDVDKLDTAKVGKIVKDAMKLQIQDKKASSFSHTVEIPDFIKHKDYSWDKYVPSVLEGMASKMKKSQEIKELTEALLKGGKRAEIGEVRDWTSGRAMKTTDGWVMLGGKHHGKLMGKFKEPATHKEVADTYLTQESVGEKETSKPEEPKREDPVKTDEIQDTPRHRAKKKTQKLEEKGEYVNARASAISNMGEDLKGSARHKALEWKGLSVAEKTGDAEKLIKRDFLLKAEGPQLIDEVNAKSYIKVLAMHEAMQKFPPKPTSKWITGWEKQPDDTLRTVWIEDQHGRPYPMHPANYDSISKKEDLKVLKKETVGEVKRKAREDYYEAFQRIKNKAESIAKNEGILDPFEAIKALREEALDIIKEERAKNQYSDIANNLVSYVNKTLYPGTFAKKGSVVVELNEFIKKTGYKPGESFSEEKAETVRKLLEGKKLDDILGLEKEKKTQGFNPADLYVKRAEREGPENPNKTLKSQAKYMLDKVKIRGIQWGNSVTDEEREHHMEQVSNAFRDLTDILELPEEMGSFNGKLGLAIGARGKGGVSAHYETDTKVINLTRVGGVGTLAHEWGHFFDNILGQVFYNTQGDVYASRQIDRYIMSGKDDAVGKAMVALTESPEWREYYSSVRRECRELQMSSGKIKYWTSTIEMFARSFERYIQVKLQEKGRKNTYLSGLGDNSKLWPDDKLSQKLKPHFDKLFETFKNSEYLKKALDLFQLGNAPEVKGLVEALLKAKQAKVGEVHRWADGMLHRKTADGWVIHTGSHKVKTGEEGTSLEGKHFVSSKLGRHGLHENREDAEREAKMRNIMENPHHYTLEKFRELMADKEIMGDQATSDAEGIEIRHRVGVKYAIEQGKHDEIHPENYETHKLNKLPPEFRTPEFEATNLIREVDFGDFGEETKRVVTRMLQEANEVIAKMGIRFKRGISFSVKTMISEDDRIAGQYISTEHTIELYKEKQGLNINTLFHEIGHALDYSMEYRAFSSEIPFKEFFTVEAPGQDPSHHFGRMGEVLHSETTPIASEEEQVEEEQVKELKKNYQKLYKQITGTAFYERAPNQRYLRNSTEIFARAFEVFAFGVSQKMHPVPDGEHSMFPHIFDDLGKKAEILENKFMAARRNVHLNRRQLQAEGKLEAAKAELDKLAEQLKNVRSDPYSRIIPVDQQKAYIKKISTTMREILKIDEIRKALE